MIDTEELICSNIALVHSCAKKFVGKGIEYDDLFQAGSMGLFKAARGFDESRGLQFSTYAVPAILGEMKRLFRDGGSVKVSRTLKELQLKINKVSDSFRKNGIEPTVNQIANVLEVTAEEVSEAICACQPVISLTVGDDGEEKSQYDLPCESKEEQLCDRISIEQAVNQLDEQDRKIIHLRYFKEQTQHQIAEQLNMTQVQISRREKIILNKLKKLMTG